MWRLQTHDTFGGTWLSDFVPNRLGGFIGEHGLSIVENPKPSRDHYGTSYNVHAILGQREE